MKSYFKLVWRILYWRVNIIIPRKLRNVNILFDSSFVNKVFHEVQGCFVSIFSFQHKRLYWAYVHDSIEFVTKSSKLQWLLNHLVNGMYFLKLQRFLQFCATHVSKAINTEIAILLVTFRCIAFLHTHVLSNKFNMACKIYWKVISIK